MKVTLMLAGALGAAAFPTIQNEAAMLKLRSLMSRQDALGTSAAESNCGTKACPTLDAEGKTSRNKLLTRSILR